MKIFYKTRICLFFAVVFFFVGISTHSWAERTYIVKKGDTLYRISKKFKTNIETLSRANKLDSDKLAIGTRIIIPSKKSIKKASSPVNNSATEMAPEQNIQKAEPETLEIRAGDSLSIDAGGINSLSDASELQHSNLKELLTFVSKQTVGIPYKFGSSSLKATDCSGYVQKVFSFFGIQLPRSAREQFNQGISVDKENLSIGDLVFFRTYASFPSHVGIYLGNNLFVHASTLAKKVTIDSLNTSYYVKRFIGAKRLQGLDELSQTHSPELE